MSIITTLEPFTKIKGNIRTKVIITGLIFLLGTIIAIFGQGNFLANFSNFLGILLYFMIPWTAINLMDFYIIKKGKYSVTEMFDMNGLYGKVNWKTLSTFFISVLAQIPFINAEYYQGFMSGYMGGADLAWLVGIIVPSILFYKFNHKKIEQVSALKESS